jgi:Zn-dependent protease with chaperone function
MSVPPGTSWFDIVRSFPVNGALELERLARGFVSARFILTLGLLDAAVYAVAFGAGTVLVTTLSRPWRRAADAHWTERARLAFAPGFAVLWLAVMLPPAAALLAGVGLEMLYPQTSPGMPWFWMPWLAAFAGVLTARYRWLRELWGPRVNLRSWLAGCLFLLVLLIPHLMILLLLLVVLPETPSVGGALLLGVGFLILGLLASGGGVALLRLLGVVGPAPAAVATMLEELAREMKVPGRVRVFELEWAQVNAVAWVMHRAVGFSRPLLELMAPDEVRAIAAHELAHLIEPKRVRVVRIVHLFAYLAAVPVIKYGGGIGVLAGWLMVLAIAFGYKRFARRLEVRADRLESQAIADANAYTRSMTRLHELNGAPAVMPGSPTHPHLYDRLLAGGIQPDFPRPKAPSRVKPLVAALLAAIATALVMFLILVAALCVQRLASSLSQP